MGMLRAQFNNLATKRYWKAACHYSQLTLLRSILLSLERVMAVSLLR
jgi:hypothetical protein